MSAMCGGMQSAIVDLTPLARPLLSICIPTYNRVNYLRKALTALGPWWKANEQVEIVISDNGSADCTPQYLQQLAATHPRMRVRLNQTNRGFDRNVMDCISMATGVYLHFLGDDDLPETAAFGHLLSVLARERPNVVISNYRQCGRGGGRMWQALPEESACFVRLERLLSFVGHHATFMSILTIRRPETDNGDLRRFEALAFMHLAALLDWMAGTQGNFRYNEVALVVATNENVASYSVPDLFANRLMRCFEMVRNRLDIDALLPFFRSIVSLLAGFTPMSTWYGRRSALRRLCGWSLFLDWRFSINVLLLRPAVRRVPAWLQARLAKMVHAAGFHPLRSAWGHRGKWCRTDAS